MFLVVWVDVLMNDSRNMTVRGDADQSEPVSSDALGELEVAGHDGDSLGVNGAEVGVLEEGDEVGLSSLLKSKDG